MCRPRSKWLGILSLLCCARSATAQPSRPAEPFEITDNSFLVEEAFNQEPRVFQNIVTWMRDDRDIWEAAFTQEWPLFTMKHQLSYTVAGLGAEGHSSLGVVLLNYRFQALEEGPGRPAFSPRFSVILPTGAEGTLDDRTGIQLNLPFSKQRGDLYFHWNAGFTWLPQVPTIAGDELSLTSPHAAGSVIWRVAPMLNLMLETLLAWDQVLDEEGQTLRIRSFTLNPGFRRGWNLGEQQIVVGLASPFTRTEGNNSIGVLTYFSYELPF
jgi:hypothetical protein